MGKHAGGELGRDRTQAQRPVGIIGHGRARGLVQAEMDMHAVADAVGDRHGREDGAVAQAEGGGARQFAGDHRRIGGAQCRCRGDGDLKLARAIFGEETVRREPGGAERGDEALAEQALAAECAKTVSVARPILQAGIDEFLLEGGDQLEPARLAEGSGAPAQKFARAAFPGAAVGVADIP
jgi:hypothetical protein